MCSNQLNALRRLVVGLAAVAVFAVAAATTAAAGPPAAESGSPGCLGRDTASFAQDWKTFSFEPPGVAPLVRFYGGTNPSDWLQGERNEDCTAP
jgi:hypothetical protein